MINLDLKNKDIKENDKRVLLFIITDVFLNIASESNPLTDVKAVSVIYQAYKIRAERRTIGAYRKLLETHFGIVFKTKNKGHYIDRKQYFKSQSISFESGYENIEDISGIGYPYLKQSIATCQKAINNHYYLKLFCHNFYFYNLEKVADKTLHLIPLQLFKWRDSFYLLSYSKDINDHFIVNLNKHSFDNKDVLYISTEKELNSIKEINLKEHLEGSDYIVTGRINAYEKLKNLMDLNSDYYTGACCFKVENDFSEIYLSLLDIYDEKALFYDDNHIKSETLKIEDHATGEVVKYKTKSYIMVCIDEVHYYERPLEPNY